MVSKKIKILWGAFGGCLALVILAFVAIWNGWIGYMPDMEDLQNPIDRYATQVYSADGKVIGTWNQDQQNRIHVSLDKISPYVVQALVATEDVRFYEHSGIDFIALGRAIVKRGIMGQTSAGGGSTLTQQLAKQVYSEKATTTFERLLQKPVEWIIAIKLERNFTKEEIVMMYLNQFDFLHNAVGIKNAANTYFNKEPSKLTIEEAAMLVGLCKNPSYFNPIRHPERCRERRNMVLQLMANAGYISQSTCNESMSTPIDLHFHRTDKKDGTAPYFREFLRKYMMAEKPERATYASWQYAQFVIDSVRWEQDPLFGWCNKNTKKDGTPYNIYQDGLKVYTTIDTRMQAMAEKAVRMQMTGFVQPSFNRECKTNPNRPFFSSLKPRELKRLVRKAITQTARYHILKASGMSEEDIMANFRQKIEMTVFSYHGDIDTVMSPLDSILYYKKYMRAGFCCAEAKTGAIKAYVGGVDFLHFSYDMVMDGRRQVGSTIKPYVYAMAMDNGLTPCDGMSNSSAYPGWHVRGASGGFVTLKSGLARSLNGVSTQLMKRFSPDGRYFVEFLNKFGIYLPGVVPTPTLCLGSGEISIGDMVSGYTAFVNHGIRCAPLFVTKIEDSDGQVIASFEPRVNEVISEEASYKMLDIMQAVVDHGTAGRLRYAYDVKAQMGAKTGTTNDNSDAWFMAVTPDLVCGMWVGGEDRDIHFASMSYGQGASAALPIYAYFIKQVYATPALPYKPDAVFDIPEDYNFCGGNRNGMDGMDGMDGMGIEDVYE